MNRHRRSTHTAWLLGPVLALTLLLAGACSLGPEPTPTPTRTPRPLNPQPLSTPLAGSAISGWRGTLNSYAPGAMYDDYFVRLDDSRLYGIEPGTALVRQQMDRLRDSNRVVLISGTLYVNMADVEGRRIVANSVQAEDEVIAPATPMPATDTPSPKPSAEPSTATPMATDTLTPLPPTATATATASPSSTPLPIPTASPTATPSPTETPLPTATPRAIVITDWKGEYFDNPTLSGQPQLTRNDVIVEFDWRQGAANADLPADWFSARWTGQFYFPAGDYRFRAYADDGVRVFLDGHLLIDEWHGWQDQIYSVEFREVGEGRHEVVVHYVEHGGEARVWVRWEQQGGFAGWKGEYFNSSQPGSNRAVVRDDNALNFDWGTEPPDAAVRADNFSARWTRSIPLETGNYRFWVRADDGIRVWLDNQLIIDEWYDGIKELSALVEGIPEAAHLVKVEYYDHTDQAQVRLWWEYLGRVPGEPIP